LDNEISLLDAPAVQDRLLCSLRSCSRMNLIFLYWSPGPGL